MAEKKPEIVDPTLGHPAGSYSTPEGCIQSARETLEATREPITSPNNRGDAETRDKE